MPVSAPLRIRSLKARPVDVPLSVPHPTAGGVVNSAPLVLIDLETEEGITGRSYVFCYSAIAAPPVARLVINLEGLIKGDPVVPLALDQKLQQRFRLLGPQGLTGIAMAGIDMAAWDALARAAGLPVVRLIGSEPRPIAAYDSLGMAGVDEAARDAEASVARGFDTVKFKVGYSDGADDLQVVTAARRAGSNDLGVMVDYNQSLSVPEALHRCRLLDDAGLIWIEEPTSADDYDGHAEIRAGSQTPIQMGENWWGPHDMAKALAAGASDYVMLDVMKIGGVTGWLRAAALAEAKGLRVSSHLFPEISVHLLAATPMAHWLEYQNWVDPILVHPLTVNSGKAIAPDRPGFGLEWNEAAVRQFSIQ